MFYWVLSTPLRSKHINTVIIFIRFIPQTNLIQKTSQCNCGFAISTIQIDGQILPAEWRVKAILQKISYKIKKSNHQNTNIFLIRILHLKVLYIS